jgi:pentalenic acid synthase
VLFGTVAANRDPAVFAHPDDFDVSRRTTEHLSFGFGAHFCLGAHLARAEMDVAMRVLFERLPRLHLVDEEDVCITAAGVPAMQGPNRLPVRFG